MKRALALVAGLGLATGCDGDCSLPAQIDEIVDGAPVRKCGELPPETGGQGSYEASRACVLEAIAAQAPFEVRWTVGEDDAHALLGIWSGGYQLQRIDTDGTTARVFTCRTITDLGACGTVFTDLCLQCTDESATASCD